jgi:transcriptional regulator with XRE-family HTH domain
VCDQLTGLTVGALFWAVSTRRLLKTAVGPHASEGMRRLWAVMIERRWSQTQLAAALSPPGADWSAKVNRWLYGDRRPEASGRFRMEEVLGIDPRTWDEALLETFVPPTTIEVDDDGDFGDGTVHFTAAQAAKGAA